MYDTRNMAKCFFKLLLTVYPSISGALVKVQWNKYLMLESFCTLYMYFIYFYFINKGSFGDIRLQNGTEPTEGSVEIFYENVWRRVCADDWGFEEAKTACYQLGMPVPNNTVPGGTFSGNRNRDFISQKFDCFALRPLERYRRVNLCPLTRRETPCSAGDAAVQCGIWNDGECLVILSICVKCARHTQLLCHSHHFGF